MIVSYYYRRLIGKIIAKILKMLIN